jgi:hypothetical protein
MIRLILILLAGILNPSGCSTLVKEPIGSPYLHEVEVSRTQEGLPHVHINRHLDELGWTVQLTQGVQITIEQEKLTRWEAQRFMFWPPSILIGLIQCPGSALLYAGSFGKHGATGLQYGCRRLLMQEPLQGRQPLIQSTSRIQRQESITVPSNQATVSIGWSQSPETLLSYQPDEKGTVFVRLTHLMTRLDHEQLINATLFEHPLTCTVTQGHKVVYRTSLDVSKSSLQRLERNGMPAIALDKLPTPLTIELTEFKGLPGPHVRSLQERLTQRLLTVGVNVVADTTIRQWIQDEQQLQYKGTVADDSRVSLGRWTPSTVQISAKAEATDSRTRLVLTVSSVVSGEILGKIQTEGAAGDWATAISQAEDELITLLAHR